jgi:hypothetical protein
MRFQTLFLLLCAFRAEAGRKPDCATPAQPKYDVCRVLFHEWKSLFRLTEELRHIFFLLKQFNDFAA